MWFEEFTCNLKRKFDTQDEFPAMCSSSDTGIIEDSDNLMALFDNDWDLPIDNIDFPQMDTVVGTVSVVEQEHITDSESVSEANSPTSTYTGVNDDAPTDMILPSTSSIFTSHRESFTDSLKTFNFIFGGK